MPSSSAPKVRERITLNPKEAALVSTAKNEIVNIALRIDFRITITMLNAYSMLSAQCSMHICAIVYLCPLHGA